MSLLKSFCNRCGKGFKSQASLLNHQSQPLSKCLELYNAFLQAHGSSTFPSQAQDPLEAASSATSIQPPSPIRAISPVLPSPPVASLQLPDVEMIGIESGTDGGTSALPSHYSFSFPGASQSFGKGETFLDVFNKDQYADKRNNIDFLYYPFSTQAEWELASFLLKSGLSMAQTDEFLKLQVVSPITRLKNYSKHCSSDSRDWPFFSDSQGSPQPSRDSSDLSTKS